MKQQIIMSGVGGQGILFVTRLLAEAAIYKGLQVLASETHGMAQRGGTVLSHLKVGGFSSPLIRPARADGLVLLKEENLAQHSFYLRPGGWAIINARSKPAYGGNAEIHWIDADKLAEQTGSYQSLNLIVLGFAVARIAEKGYGLYCTADDISALLHKRFSKRENLLKTALSAFDLGVEYGRT
jgi:indolepyruvate ferredoxin oxidoreductase beta subunit